MEWVKLFFGKAGLSGVRAIQRFLQPHFCGFSRLGLGMCVRLDSAIEAHFW
jgi:hypothetical protein